MCEPQGPGEAVHVCPLGAAGPPHILRCVPENRKGEGCVYVGGVEGGREGGREGKGEKGRDVAGDNNFVSSGAHIMGS